MPSFGGGASRERPPLRHRDGPRRPHAGQGLELARPQVTRGTAEEL